MNRLAARINWLWRLAMTGFCFALFGVGGLLLSLVWFNLLLIVQRDRAAVAAWRVAALRPASASS